MAISQQTECVRTCVRVGVPASECTGLIGNIPQGEMESGGDLGCRFLWIKTHILPLVNGVGCVAQTGM